MKRDKSIIKNIDDELIQIAQYLLMWGILVGGIIISISSLFLIFTNISINNWLEAGFFILVCIFSFYSSRAIMKLNSDLKELNNRNRY